MLPSTLLNTAVGHPILVELKNGETYNGHLEKCDNFMNLSLREVILTSVEGDRFWSLSETFIRGNTIKYLRIPDEVIEKVREEMNKKREAAASQRGGAAGGNRGGRGGRVGRGGRGSGRGGGGGGYGRGGGYGQYQQQRGGQ